MYYLFKCYLLESNTMHYVSVAEWIFHELEEIFKFNSIELNLKEYISVSYWFPP